MPSGIAQRIKEIRRVLGPWPGKLLPRQQLGQRVGVDESTVKKWETEEVTISTDNALKLAEVAGCDVEWILAGRGRPPKQAAAAPGMPQDERSGRLRIAEPATSLASGTGKGATSSPVAVEPAPPLRPEQKETADMAANALRRALYVVQNNLHGKRDREIMAEELEHFADQLRERLGFDAASADLYKAALNLRKQP